MLFCRKKVFQEKLYKSPFCGPLTTIIHEIKTTFQEVKAFIGKLEVLISNFLVLLITKILKIQKTKENL